MSPGKREVALDHLGADAFLVSRDRATPSRCDGGGGHHGWRHRYGVGGPPGRATAGAGEAEGTDGGSRHPERTLELPALAIVASGKRVAGSGGDAVVECQAMLNFAGEQVIVADVEVVRMDDVDAAIQRHEGNDVRYRFLADVAGSRLPAAA
jgi:cinnamyl-alcohol dehydrogenase